MAPMTRSRAIGNIPNDTMAEYYAQRADAGLIITEGTSPSPNGLGYSRIPGIFSDAQVEGWKKVTKAVHAKQGKIFVQLMHTGRIGHPLNLPPHALLVSPSAVQPKAKMFTDQEGLQDIPVPKGMSSEDLEHARMEFINAAAKAIKAGFDGVELHNANGYLLEQFLSPFSNMRNDQYGGSIENRCRFILEVVEGVCKTIGAGRTGIRLSPYGVASDMPHYPEIEDTYTYLAEKLDTIGIAYIHLVDHSSMGAPEVPLAIKKTIRKKFMGTLILSGGYTPERADNDLESGFADLIAFGKPFINNPDLVSRIQQDQPLNTELDTVTFYSPGPKGYTDYPVYQG